MANNNPLDNALGFDGDKNTEKPVAPPDPTPDNMSDPIADDDVVYGSSSGTLMNYSSSVQFEQDDIMIPHLRLAQGLTKEVSDGTAKPGQWLMTGYDLGDDSLIVVPLMFARRRELREDEGDRKVLCASENAEVGIGNPGGVCSECPLSKWTDGPKGKRIPPKCVFMYSYMVHVVGAGPAILDFKRTSIDKGKLINTMAAQRGLGNFAVQLTSKSEKGPRGSYFVPVVTPFRVDPGVLEEARERSF